MSPRSDRDVFFPRLGLLGGGFVRPFSGKWRVVAHMKFWKI